MVEVDVKRKSASGGSGGGASARVRRDDGCGYLLLRWLIAALVIWGVSWLLQPHVEVEGFVKALVVAAVLGLLNVFVRPIMIVLTLPITIVTLGLFLLVINALLLMFTGWLIDGFHVENFWWALGAAVIISLVNAVVGGRAVRG